MPITRLLMITLGAVALAPVASAQPCEDASTLRVDLEQESRRARRWNMAWRIGYTTVAVAQFAVAASGTASDDNTTSLWVGGTKSALGALGQWFSPLRIDVPPATGETCADRTALRAAAERAARDERRAFWLAHIGGLAINVAGTVVLGETVSWRTGLISFATGYPVGLLANYTMPRASWRRVREPGWSAGIVTRGDQYALVVAGTF